MSGPDARGLFVSDIDGTLVTPDKTLTPRAREAAAALAVAGIPFTVVSSRPVRGMAQVVSELGVTLPFAAFNGGSLAAPGGAVIAAHRLGAEAARAALDLLSRRGVDVWVFADDQWMLRDPRGENVPLERRTVGFDPLVVTGFEAVIDRVDKLVAVSNDRLALDGAEQALRAALAGSANIERSQPYYVDVTHPLANKGEAVKALAARVGADLARTVVIGDMTNDIAMFKVAGFAIAMGQAPANVKAAAAAVTGSNLDDGFANAVQTWVIPRLGAAEAA